MEYSIKRTINEKEHTIPLTEDELQEIHRMLRQKDEQEFLIDELLDLDEDENCFGGYDRDKLIENAAFLSAVDALWDKYNGHGGDRTENLREAVGVITSRMRKTGAA